MNCKVGDKVCNCTIIKECGEGSYGKVFLAEDQVGRLLALKIIPNTEKYSRELAGLRNYKDCNHPNLLKILHIETSGSDIIYTMDAADDLNEGEGEYLPDTLANRLARDGRLDGKEVTAMVNGLLDGLEELHGKGLVHRDVKPDNILWVNKRPTLADAGLITQAGQGSLVGSPSFMSPRLLSGNGKAEASDDFYALAKVIYCALTGNCVEDYPAFPGDMTISLDADLGRAYRDPCCEGKEIHSASEFRALLAGKRKEVSSRHKTMTGTDGGTYEKSKAPWIFAAILLLLVAGGSFILGSGQKEQNVAEPPEKLIAVEQPNEPLAVEMTEKPVAVDQPEEPLAVEMTEKPVAVDQPEEPLAGEMTEMPVAVERAEKPVVRPEPPIVKTWDEVEKEFSADLQKKVLPFLDAVGFFKNDRLSEFLDFRPLSSVEMFDRVISVSTTPGLGNEPVPSNLTARNGSSKKVGNAIAQLFGSVDYMSYDEKKLKERQEYWRRQSGDRIEIQKKMLHDDPVMQAVALDLFIRHAVNVFLDRNKFTPEDETNLKGVIFMRLGLLEPRLACMRSGANPR